MSNKIKTIDLPIEDIVNSLKGNKKTKICKNQKLPTQTQSLNQLT